MDKQLIKKSNRTPKERRRENTRKPKAKPAEFQFAAESGLPQGLELCRADIEDMIYRATEKVLTRDRDGQTQPPLKLPVGNGKIAGTIGLEDHPTSRPAMLPSAIDHLHNSLGGLSDVIRQLEDKLDGVLTPAPEEKDGCGVMPCETAPAAVRGVRMANDRVQFLTAQIRKLIERLEA